LQRGCDFCSARVLQSIERLAQALACAASAAEHAQCCAATAVARSADACVLLLLRLLLLVRRRRSRVRRRGALGVLGLLPCVFHQQRLRSVREHVGARWPARTWAVPARRPRHLWSERALARPLLPPCAIGGLVSAIWTAGAHAAAGIASAVTGEQIVAGCPEGGSQMRE
jgi:hypothetical protein